MDKLNFENNVPLYIQISKDIRNKINSNIWKSNSKIPSEKELGEIYGVSRITIRNAVKDLVEDELLIKKQGKGTFIAPNRIRKQLQNFLSFTDACINVGMIPSAKVISVEMKNTTRKYSNFFNLTEDDIFVFIRRLRLANNNPVIYETNIFPEKFKYLVMKDLEGSLYEILKTDNIFPERSVKTIEVCSANKIEEEFLGVPVGTPLLLLNDMVYDNNLEPLHICKQIIRTDLFKLVI